MPDVSTSSPLQVIKTRFLYSGPSLTKDNATTTKIFNGILNIPYTLALIPSSMNLPFKYPALGKYIPTQASKMQKLQKVKTSLWTTTVTSKLLLAVAKIMVRSRAWEISWYFETTRLNIRDPSMTEPMKQAKIMPSGRDGESACWVAFNAGVQKKTKRYMLPSKKQEARPMVRIFLSVKTVLSAFLVGAEEATDSAV